MAKHCQTFKEYCIDSGRLSLLRQWHPEKNRDLTPDDVASGSRRKVWWTNECGHEWQQEVYNRRIGVDICPVCAGHIVFPGFNDLASCNPDLASQWHPTKNRACTPQNVRPYTHKKVWWRCEKGHEWQATIGSRTAGASCPVCANRIIVPGINDLAYTHPELAAQWHPTKNGTLTPQKVSHGYDRKVWWICEKGHEWQVKITDRTWGSHGCPYCTGQDVLKGFNDLATTCPNIAEQWHPTLNGVLTPEMVTAGSHRKVWWICSEGHVWKAAIYNRAGKKKRTNCPVCAGNIKMKDFGKNYDTCFTANKESVSPLEKRT